MELSRLRELLPFVDNFELEKFIVRAVKQRVVEVRLCHRTKSISFGANIFAPDTAKSADGPQLQMLQSDMMKSQLTALSKRLNAAVDMIHPGKRASGMEAIKREVFDKLSDKVRREHQGNLKRKAIIETRKVRASLLLYPQHLCTRQDPLANSNHLCPLTPGVH